MSRLTYLIFMMIAFACVGCVRPLDPEEHAYENLLVVEALITDQPVRQQVFLRRTTPLTTESAIIPETGASVWLEIQNSFRISFDEQEPGVYRTAQPYAAGIGQTYRLLIERANGQMYESEIAQMLPTPPIDSVYADFEPFPTPRNPYGGNFRFYLDSRNNSLENKYFRWVWRSTFKLTVTQPSRWHWTGGNSFIVREYGGENHHLQVEFCWQTDTSSQILLNALINERTGIIRQPMHSFHSDQLMMQLGYAIEVRQYAISEASYNFWNLIAETTQTQGTFFDKQPGTIRSNIRNTSDQREVVLGNFEVVQEQVATRQYAPLDFLADGFRTRGFNYVDCQDLAVQTSPVSQIGEFMERYKDAWVIGYFVTTPSGVVYLLRKCSDCTLYGNNTPPDFWEE